MLNSIVTRHANQVRYVPGTGKGHVESYFFRANHPTERKAIWLKATICAPPNDPQAAKADAWCIYFDGDAGKMWGHRETVPLQSALFDTQQAPRSIEVGTSRFELDVLHRCTERELSCG